MTTVAERKAMRERADRATKGPWGVERYPDINTTFEPMVYTHHGEDGFEIIATADRDDEPHDLDFIAAAREDLPAVLEDLDLALELLERADSVLEAWQEGRHSETRREIAAFLKKTD